MHTTTTTEPRRLYRTMLTDGTRHQAWITTLSDAITYAAQTMSVDTAALIGPTGLTIADTDDLIRTRQETNR